MKKKNCHDDWIEMTKEEEEERKKRSDVDLLRLLFPKKIIQDFLGVVGNCDTIDED